jgi:F0F1-type ATP synthase membrane subunit b/b'
MLKNSEGKIREMEEEIKNEISNFTKTRSQIQDLLTREAKSEIEKLSKSITEEISSIFRSTSEKLNERVSQAEKNIENYKERKLKELDQRIYQIIGEVAEKTIGKAIDLSTHEELVMEALEKAKKEKFF